MRVAMLLLKCAVFLLLLVFAAKNADNVVVRLFLGYDVRLPLVAVLFAFFALGSMTGLMAGLSRIMRQRREILGLKRELRQHARTPAAPATAESV